MTGRALLLSALLAWTLFSFGGVYAWSAAAAAAASGLLLAASRPPARERGTLRALDALLAACFLWGAAHLLPLPASLIDRFSPSSAGVLEMVSLAGPQPTRPISIDPAGSAHALLVLGSALATFWSARSLFRFGGVRAVARAVAFCGLIAAGIGILQEASGTRRIYWWWAPLSDGPAGFGPFINRNHFAAWAVMAAGLTLGYLAARAPAADGNDRFRSLAARVRRRLDGRTLWLLAATGALLAGMMLTLSRSGLAASAAAALAAGLLAPRRRPGRWRWPGLLVGAMLAAGIVWTGPARLVDRWLGAQDAQRDRTAIWRETLPVVRDFWPTGSGIGSYGAAMTVYRQSERTVHFNQAHNHYLQILAEGGAPLLLLAAVAGVLFAAAARQCIARDRSRMVWLRVGAAAGLTGLAAQSVWETAARMPANALLAAVLAAVAVYEPERAPVSRGANET